MTLIEGIRFPAAYGSPLGCSSCRNPDVATVDLYNGRRCINCPPVFSGAVAVLLMRRENARAALAYIRTYAAMEATS